MAATEKGVTCPICASPAQLWATKSKGRETYRIHRCATCGYGFVSPRPPRELIEAYYRDSTHSLPNDSVSSQSVLAAEAEDPNSTIDARRMLDTVNKLRSGRTTLSRRLLDVGAGYGFFSREALRAGFDVIPLDPAGDQQHICRAISGITPLCTTFEAVTLPTNSLGVVLMSQVLEHALDVQAWVAKAGQLLEPEGIIAIALPNFGSLQRFVLREHEPYICPPAHLNFFTPGALLRLLDKSGFDIEAVQHVSRVPRSTIQKRVRGPAAPLARPLWSLATQISHAIDAVGLGSIINVYARRRNGARPCA